MRFFRVLRALLVLLLAVMFGSRAMGLRRRLVVIGSILMRCFWHFCLLF
jgi:hypothetical protein